MRKFWVALLLLPALAHAQLDSVMLKRSDMIRVVDGVLFTFSSPARWKGKDWLKVGGVAATCAAITLLDEPVRNFWSHQNSKFMDGFERVGYHYGKPYSALAITGGFYLTGIIFKNEWA